VLPDQLARRLKVDFNLEVFEALPCQGGSINQAARLRTSRGNFFLKWNHAPLPHMFTREAQGLQLLRDARVLRVPKVLTSQDPSPDGCPGFLLLEWIKSGPVTHRGMARLGENLAMMHRLPGQKFGLDTDNYIGSTLQVNGWHSTWLDFFRDHRLGYQMALAAQRGLLPAARRGQLEKLQSKLPEWLPSGTVHASLLHGDLWSGNLLQNGDDEPVLIDPAVYYGHRESDLAFTELFGGFSPEFYKAYGQTWPLDPGYAERKDLYNLYHLLNHLNLFGESYGGAIDAILRHYLP